MRESQCARRAAVPKAELAMGVNQRTARAHEADTRQGLGLDQCLGFLFLDSYGEASNLTVQSTLYRDPRRQRDHIPDNTLLLLYILR